MTRYVRMMVLILVAVLFPVARGIWMDLPKSGEKCLSEELRNNVVVLANYYAFISETHEYNTTIAPTISIKLTSPYGNEIHHKKNVTFGDFGFTTTESGTYRACFELDSDGHQGKAVSVGMDWKVGIAAKDWDSIAKKEKIEGLELEFKRLEENVEAIHQNLRTLMYRSFDMRMVSNTTNARVAWFSLMSGGVCISVAALQVLYLRRYFRKQKLI